MPTLAALMPGSMGLCREIYQEGFRIPPVKLMRGGRIDRDVLHCFFLTSGPPEEREGDLRAQLAACHTGTEPFREISRRYGLPRQAGSRGIARLFRTDDAVCFSTGPRDL